MKAIDLIFYVLFFTLLTHNPSLEAKFLHDPEIQSWFSFLNGRLIESSAPYLSGDTLREFCDLYFDETTTSFAPEAVKPGSIIFVNAEILDSFFQLKHPYIKNPYVLVSHNSDQSAPGKFAPHLDDDKIIAWFAQNPDIVHSKLHPIPIGLSNKMWPIGNTEILSEAQTKIGVFERDHLLYMNFKLSTCLQERSLVYNIFAGKDYCWAVSGCSWKDYLTNLTKVKFVLSPRGNGLDCVRTWESLYLGAIPIVKTSPMDSMFEGLPVLIINDWTELTPEFLENKYREMKEKTYSLEKLYAPYWEQKIKKTALPYRKNENIRP